MKLKEIIEKNIISIITIAVTLIIMIGGFKWQIDNMDNRITKIEDMKLEVKLMEIQTDLKYIRQIIEKK